MSYSSTTLGGGPDDQRLNLQTPNSNSTYLQGQCDEYLIPLIEPAKSNSWDTLHTSGSGPDHQRSAFTHQSTDADCTDAPVSVIPSPPESHDSSSGPCFSHDNTSPADDGSWNDWFTLQPMSNTATNGLFSGPWDGNCGNFGSYNTKDFFPPPDSTLGDRNIDPSLEAAINLLPPLHSANSPNQPLEQALQFAGKPDFPGNGRQLHFQYQAFPEKGGMFTNLAGSTSKVKDLGIYSQYDPARVELKYPSNSHLPQLIERPDTSSVNQSEFVSHSDFVSQSESLQNTGPPLGNSLLTTSRVTSSEASHNSITQFSTGYSTNAKTRSARTCSHCLKNSHNISQCPLRPCRYCGQMGHVSATCAVRRRKNMDHRRDATKRRRHMARDLRLVKSSSEIKVESTLHE